MSVATADDRASPRRWIVPLSWAALALAGAGALLAMTRAGPVVGYHHLRWPENASATWWGLCSIVALQWASVARAVFFGSRPAFAEWSGFLTRELGALLVCGTTIALAFARAKIARPPEAYLGELAFSSASVVVAAANLALAARALPGEWLAQFDTWVDRAFGTDDSEPRPAGPDRFAWGVAVAVAVVCAALAMFVYQRHPHVPDEVSYIFHARMLAAGELSIPSPPVAEAFDVDLMHSVDGRWFSPVPPGWSIALAMGERFGAGWCVNPLITGLAILAAYGLLRECVSPRRARMTLVLLALSPWSLFLGMGFMTHAWTHLCGVCAAWAVARARRGQPELWAALAGVAIGVVSWIRPLDGLVWAALLGLWSIGFGGARLRVSAVATLVVSTAAVGAAVLVYNRALTGDGLRHPIMDYVDRIYGPGKNDLGFGPDKGLDWGGLDPWPGHSPFQALVNTQFNVFALDAELTGWSVGAVPWILLGFAWSRRRAVSRACACAILAIVLANGLYWFSGGPDFGARYWYLALLPCTLLIALGLEGLAIRLGEAAPRLRFAVFLAALGSAFLFLPWRAIDKYRGYRGMVPGAAALAREHGFGRSLVLVRGERHPDFASAAVDNPLDWEADAPIFAWDRDAATRARLLEHYADRPVWIIDGPSRGRGAFRLVAGPLNSAAAAAWEAK